MTLEERRSLLLRLILAYGETLRKEITFANPFLLLATIAECESTFGLRNRPRYERAFDEGGFYFNETNAQKWNYFMHGSLVAHSFSSFQILFVSAVEAGFSPGRSPLELSLDEVAIFYVVRFIRNRLLNKGPLTIRTFGVGYNGGSPSSTNPNALAYGQKFELAYAGVAKLRGVTFE